jgi:hypothetical protein
MDLITLTLNKNHLWTGITFVGLGTLTYLANRYINNTKQTKNQSYYKPAELIKGIPNLNYMQTQHSTQHSTQHIIYIFWNGDINTTYLLIDLLLQDKMIQPLYIERYTIIKELEKETLKKLLEKINKQNQINKKNQMNTTTSTNTNKDKQFLNTIVELKKIQDYELKQLEILRLMILSKYPEFNNNLFPTIYITSIEKDLEMTSHFYNILQELKPIYYDGIDLIEQIIRYIKYSGYIKKNTVNNTIPRILLGCHKNYKNYDLLLKLINKNIVSVIELPLKNMNNEDITYVCSSFFPNEIMNYFLSNKKLKQ